MVATKPAWASSGVEALASSSSVSFGAHLEPFSPSPKTVLPFVVDCLILVLEGAGELAEAGEELLEAGEDWVDGVNDATAGLNLVAGGVAERVSG